MTPLFIVAVLQFTMFTDGWLAKYCIIPRYMAEAYARTFEVVDSENAGWLSPIDTLLALRASNPHLSDAQEEFMYRVRHAHAYDVRFVTSRFVLYLAGAADDWLQRASGS